MCHIPHTLYSKQHAGVDPEFHEGHATMHPKTDVQLTAYKGYSATRTFNHHHQSKKGCKILIIKSV